MDAPIIVDDVRVRGVGKSFDSLGKSVFEEIRELEFKPLAREAEKDGQASKCHEKASVYFEDTGRLDVPVYLLENLEAGDEAEGPGASSHSVYIAPRTLLTPCLAALVLDGTQTIVLSPGWFGRITSKHLMATRKE